MFSFQRPNQRIWAEYNYYAIIISGLCPSTIDHRPYFCYWAHERVGVFTLAQQDENRKDSCHCEYAAIWEVEYDNSDKKKVIAIECDVKPRMYLRLLDQDDKSSKLMAMFLGGEVNPAAKFPPTKKIE